MKAIEPGRRRLSRMDRDLIEGEVAIEMVARGAAVTVSVNSLRFAERIAPILAAQAQQAQVRFRLERHGDSNPSLVFGPRLARDTPR